MRLFLLLSLGLVGCGPQQLRLPRPPASAGSLVLARPTPAGMVVEAQPYDQAVFGFELETPGVLEVLLYGPTLDELGLPRGVLPPAPAGGCGGRALPEFGVVGRYQAAVEGATDPVPAWTEEEVPSAALRSFRMQAPCPCRRLVDLQTVPLPGPRIRTAATVDDHTVLIGVGDSGQFDGVLVEPDRVRTGTIAGFPRIPVALHLVSAEELYASGEAGLSAGTVQSGLQVIEPFDGRLVTGIGGDADQLYTATSSAQLFRGIGGGRTLLYDGLALRGSTRQRTQLVVSGPSEVYVALESSLGVVHWRAAGVATLPLEIESRGVTAMAQVPGLGIVVGTGFGTLYRVEADRWVALGAEVLGRAAIIKILPVQDGFWMITDVGTLQQYVTGFGLCPEITEAGPERFMVLAAAGDRLFLAGPVGDQGQALWARPILP